MQDQEITCAQIAEIAGKRNAVLPQGHYQKFPQFLMGNSYYVPLTYYLNCLNDRQ